MNNCYFCEYAYQINNENNELIEKTETKTYCCNTYYCKYHENDLFQCSICEKIYCNDFIDECKNNKTDKCGKCFGEFCKKCFYILNVKYWSNNICNNCKDMTLNV